MEHKDLVPIKKYIYIFSHNSLSVCTLEILEIDKCKILKLKSNHISLRNHGKTQSARHDPADLGVTFTLAVRAFVCVRG